jgi:spore coat protein U-like protein
LPAATTVVVQTPPAAGSTTPGTSSIPVPGSAGTPISIGFNPGGLKNCTGDTRNILEGTIGFWYRFYDGAKGRIQWGPQYSYIVRNIWRGTGNPADNISGDPSARDGMFLTSFRYYLP